MLILELSLHLFVFLFVLFPKPPIGRLIWWQRQLLGIGCLKIGCPFPLLFACSFVVLFWLFINDQSKRSQPYFGREISGVVFYYVDVPTLFCTFQPKHHFGLFTNVSLIEMFWLFLTKINQKYSFFNTSSSRSCCSCTT